MSPDEYAQEIKGKYGTTLTSDGQRIMDLDDRDVVKRMVTRYPGEKTKIQGVDEYLAGDLPPTPPQTPQQEKAQQTYMDVLKKFGTGVVNKFNERDANVKEHIRATDAGEQNPVSEFIQKSGEAAGFAGDVGFEAVKALLPDDLKQGIKDALAGISSTEEAQGLAEKYTSWKSQNPELAEDLEAGFNVATVIPGIGAGSKIVEKGVQIGADAAKAAAEAAPIVKEAAESAARNVSEEVASRAESSAIKSAQKRVVPDYESLSGKGKGALIDETVSGKPRVEEGGIIKGRRVNMTQLEDEAAREVASLPGYKAGMTNLQAHNLVDAAIAKEAQGLETSLAREGIAVPPQQIKSIVKKAVDAVSENSLIFQKSDPVIGQYMRVLENAIKQNDGTLKGVLKIRKAMDAAYKNAGKHFPTGGEKIAALDEIHRGARDALQEFLINTARGTDVKAALRKQWNLFRADDVILDKASKEAGSTIGRVRDVIRAHPIGSIGAALTVPAVGGLILNQAD